MKRFKGFRWFRGFRGEGIAYGDEYEVSVTCLPSRPIVILSEAKNLGTWSI